MIEFTVYGTPRPQGSMRAFRSHTTGRVINQPSSKLMLPWRQEISRTVAHLRPPVFAKGIPVLMTMDFFFARPKSAGKRQGVTVPPDLDKLQRCVLDALKGVLLHDDSQVVSIRARKHYEPVERVEIRVEAA